MGPDKTIISALLEVTMLTKIETFCLANNFWLFTGVQESSLTGNQM